MTTSWLRRYGFAFLAWLVVMPALVTIAAPAPAGASSGAAVAAAPAAPTGETSDDDAAAAEDAATAEACALERALAALQELFYRPAPRISPDHRILQYVELETWLAIDPAAWVEQQATESCTVTRQTETEGEDGETETQTTETTVSVTALATPAATIWEFTDGVTVRCEGPGVEYTPGAAGPAECGRYFENTTLVTPVAFSVHIEYGVEWQSSAGSSGELTMNGEPLDQYRLTVGEIQTFLTDVSSPRPGPPPGHNPIDSNQPIDDSDCHWTQPWNCRDELIDAGVEIIDDLVPQWVKDLIDEVIAFLTGCAEFAGEAIAGIGDIISQLRQLFTDPEAFRDEKLEVAKALYEGFKEDPEGFATEVLVQFLDLETLEEDPARWAGKVVCEVAVGILTGGAVSSISTRILNRLDDFKDAVRRWRRNRDDDNNGDDNDPGNGDDDGNGNPCRSSFPTGTMVMLGDGTHRPIQSVRPGDTVLAADPLTGRWQARPVLDQWSYLDTDEMATLALLDGSQVTATDHHPFWVDNRGQWVELEDVQAGDSLLTPDGVTTVAAVDQWPSGPTLVWELTVATDHSFAVKAGREDVLVHNGCNFDRHTTPASPSGYADGASDGGPGQWDANSPNRPVGADYQSEVTGAPLGTEYRVNGTRFDGYDPDRGVLLDAKEWNNFPPTNSAGEIVPGVRDSILKEAGDQVAAAGNGNPIEWIVSNADNAQLVAELFADEGIDIVITLYP